MEADEDEDVQGLSHGPRQSFQSASLKNPASKRTRPRLGPVEGNNRLTSRQFEGSEPASDCFKPASNIACAFEACSALDLESVRRDAKFSMLGGVAMSNPLGLPWDPCQGGGGAHCKPKWG